MTNEMNETNEKIDLQDLDEDIKEEILYLLYLERFPEKNNDPDNLEPPF